VRWTRRVEQQMQACAKILAARTGVKAAQILRMMEEGGRFTIGYVTVQFEAPGLTPLPGRRYLEADSYADFR
jgi:hypothetical protein